MREQVSRRRFNQVGASIGMMALAGCEGWSPTQSTNDGGAGHSNAGSSDSTSDIAEKSIAGSFSYIIEKRDGVVRSVDGRTGEVVFEGVAGEDDATVIQGTFDEINGETIEGVGGSVFIRQATYEIRDGEGFSALGVSANNTQVVSDFAHLRFHRHNVVTEGGIEELIDFNIAGNNTRVSGLILDGNKANRTLASRTLDISNCEHVWIDSCIIKNGKMVDGKRGYGIGGPNNASHVTVSNCVLANNDSHGIHPGGPELMADHKFINCSFLGNGLGIGARNGATRTIIANNYFSGNKRGISMIGGEINHKSILITGNLFVDNYRESEGSTQAAISDAFNHVRISNNIFSLPKVSSNDEREMTDDFHLAIGAVDGAGTVEISNNHIDGGNGPGIYVSAESGEDVAVPLERIIISDNYVGDIFGSNWPLFLRNTKRALVQDNYFQQPGSRAPSKLLFEAPIEHLAVRDNVLENVEMDLTDGIADSDVSGTISW